MIVADTSGLLAYFMADDPVRDDVARYVDSVGEELAVSPYVVAEVDYLLLSRQGVDAELAALDEVVGGDYRLVSLTEAEVAAARDLVRRYRDQAIGITDASLVVLADRFRTKRILTLDRRHFGVLRPLSGGRFKLLP